MSTFARHHDELRKALKGFEGKTLATSKIKELFQSKYPELDIAWVHPSDHCSNHVCKGAYKCAQTEKALFFRVKRGYYKVL